MRNLRAIIPLMRKKVFPVPSDAHWCIYLDCENKPTGELGHICIGFKNGHAVMSLFSIGEEKHVYWIGKMCTYCHAGVPNDAEETIRFVSL
jgi:hypothetical protein